MNCGNGFILQMMLFDKFKFESHMQYCTIFFELHMDTCFSLNLSTNVNIDPDRGRERDTSDFGSITNDEDDTLSNLTPVLF